MHIGIYGKIKRDKDIAALIIGAALDTDIDIDKITEEITDSYDRHKIDLYNNCPPMRDVYFDTFGGLFKLMMTLMTNCDVIMSDESERKNLYISMNSFAIYHNTPENVYSAEELYNIISKDSTWLETHDAYMNLNEFIVYFGKHIMRRYFGRDVLVKSMKAGYLGDTAKYNIYHDMKTISEMDYIKSRGGITVKVECDAPSICSEISDIQDDTQFDYVICIGSPESIKYLIDNIKI